MFKHITMFDLQFPYHVNRLSFDLYKSMTTLKFTTLANISQSSISAHQLIQSGFLSLLVDVLIGKLVFVAIVTRIICV